MKQLRHGYTTGACAAAAAKAALTLFITGKVNSTIDIPMPGGDRVSFDVVDNYVLSNDTSGTTATIIKDAGDDPDVTNGAHITATVTNTQKNIIGTCVHVTGGQGVGKVTKPGLSVPVGQYAINPVPKAMIIKACLEVTGEGLRSQAYLVQISVKDGEEISKKTLNSRLGIIGGISILGTTGIVKPISVSAWKATITTSMKVAKEAGVKEIVLSTGRTSESGYQKAFDVPEEALVMMGDYLGFALREASLFGFTRIHYAGMWAKMLKGVLGKDNTHVRHGLIEKEKIYKLFSSILDNESLLKEIKHANTARHIYELLVIENQPCIKRICEMAKNRFETISDVPVDIILIDNSKNMVHKC